MFKKLPGFLIMSLHHTSLHKKASEQSATNEAFSLITKSKYCEMPIREEY